VGFIDRPIINGPNRGATGRVDHDRPSIWVAGTESLEHSQVADAVHIGIEQRVGHRESMRRLRGAVKYDVLFFH